MNNTAEQLKALLIAGVVFFEFKKKDGSVRKALGTTHPGIVEGILGTEKEINDKAVAVVRNAYETIDEGENGGGEFPEDFLQSAIEEGVNEVMDLLNAKHEKESKRTAKASTATTYFDLEKHEFRSIAEGSELNIIYPAIEGPQG